jgi:transposase InsO family protein
VCLQAKPNRSCYPGKLQPLPVPSEAWETVYMDFIEGLPRSGNDNCVLVVVDKFTRYAYFITLLHPYTASTMDSVFLNRVYKFHGMPASIIYDTDHVFTSKFWQSLFKLLGTHLRMSSSYHPQTDGQMERVNQCLETFLCCFVHACPRKWYAWLATTEFWYNTSHHSALC